MKFRILLVLFFMLSAVSDLYAQQEPVYTHYWMLEPSFNPAAAGKTEKLNVALAYNLQLSGFENSPKTMYAAVDIQLALGNTRHGVGAYFLTDNLGLFAHQRFVGQYNYKLPLWGGVFAIGAQVDLLNDKIDGSKAVTNDGADPAVPTASVNGSKVDASAGLYYLHRNWYAGLSSLHLTAPMITLGETYQYQTTRTYFFTAGYNIKSKNPFITIQPSLLGVYDGSNWLANITAKLDYQYEKRHLFVGATYGVNRSCALFVGGAFMGVVLTYSYEAYTTGVGLSHGSHEVAIGYQMDLNLSKRGKNKYKSVRIL